MKLRGRRTNDRSFHDHGRGSEHTGSNSFRVSSREGWSFRSPGRWSCPNGSWRCMEGCVLLKCWKHFWLHWRGVERMIRSRLQRKYQEHKLTRSQAVFKEGTRIGLHSSDSLGILVSSIQIPAQRPVGRPLHPVADPSNTAGLARAFHASNPEAASARQQI